MTAFSRLRAALLASAAATALLAAASAAQALPTGGTVVAEQVPGTTITVGEGGNDMTITQQGDRVVINWTDYDIGSDDSVQYIQPNSGAIAFNRVLGGSVADIQGSLTGDGGVFIFSPGGMMIGGGAYINVGAFLASATQLPESEFSNVLSGPQLNLPPPGSPTPGFPGVTIMQGASVTASNGFIALVGSNLTIDGSLYAEGEVVYVAAEGAFFGYQTDPEFGISLATFTPGYVTGRGEVTVNQGSAATVYAGAGFALVTPPPVLQPGFQALINLDGLITADGAFQATNRSVILSAGPAIPPGHESDTSGLVSPGSLGIVLDTQDLVLDAQEGVLATAGTLRLGEMNAGGDIELTAFGDIDFRGAVSASGGLFAHNALGLGGQGGIGNVNVFDDWSVDGLVVITTYGDFTMLANAEISSDAAVLISGNFDSQNRIGVNTFNMGADTTISADTVGITSEGAVTLDVNASIYGADGYAAGGGVRIAQLRDGGGITMHSGALISGTGVTLASRGLVDVQDGAMIHSWYDGNAWWDYWPVSIYDSELGGVLIQAADMNVSGNIASSQGEGGYGGLILTVTDQSSELYVGGPDTANAPGVWRLSNDEFQNLYGFVSIGPAPGAPAPSPLEVLDLDIDGNYTPLLLLTSRGAGDIRVSGTVRGFAETGGECEIECGAFSLGDPPEVRFGQWVALVGVGQAPDSWVSLIPRDILVTGALGTEDNPLGAVRMAAQRDILIGTPSYVAAAQSSSVFDPQFPQQVDAPDDGHLFVATSEWNMFANGRVMQQNSALLNEGNTGFLAYDTPDADGELFPYRDFAQSLAEVESEMYVFLDFGSNTPVFPDYSAGPARISLHGTLYDAFEDEFLIGDDVAEHPHVLASEFSTGPTYFINDCQIGGCDTGTFGGFFAGFSPAVGFQYPAIIARLPGETIVNQVAQRVIIDWEQFDIGADETVTFNQPSTSAITYNRAEFSGPYLQGHMSGDGGVFLFSPQGMTVEDGAEIDVGSLLLSATDLPDTEYNAALTSNTLSLPPALFVGEGIPTVAVNEGATITAQNGFVALVASSIEMHGDITASDNVLYVLGEGATLQWDIGPNDPPALGGAGVDSLINLRGAAQYVAGRGTIALDHSGSVDAGGGFALITPPPVLAGSQDTVLNLGGSIAAADTLVEGGNLSVILNVGGALRPGYDETNTLVAPGAGGLILDASGGAITAAQDVGGGANGVSFGEVTTPGHFGYGATGDIAFFGEVVVGSFGVGNGSQASLPFGVTGDGDFAFHADVTTTTGDLIFGTRGHVAIDPGVSLTSEADLLFGDLHPLPGAQSVTIGAGASLSAGERLSFNSNQGPLLIGAGAELDAWTDLTFIAGSVSIGQGVLLAAGGDIGFTSLGATTIGDDSDLEAGESITWNSSQGPVTIGTGAELTAGTDLRFIGGSVAIGPSALLSAGGHIEIDSLGATSIGAGTELLADDYITIDSTGTLSLQSGAILDAGSDLVFNGSNIHIGPSVQLSAGNDLLFTSLGDVLIEDAADLSADGDIEWTSQGSTVIGEGVVIDAGDDVIIDAGSVGIGLGSSLSAFNDVEITSGSTLSVGDSVSLVAGGAVALTSTGAATLGQGVVIDAGQITITSVGLDIGNDADLLADGGIDIDAGSGALAVASTASLSAGTDISLSGGSVTIGSGGSLAAGEDLDIQSAAGLSIGSGLSAGANITLSSSGPLTFLPGADVSAGVDLAFHGSDVTVGNGAQLSAGNDIEFSSQGLVSIGSDASLTAGGDIGWTSQTATTIGQDATLVAGEEIHFTADSVSIGPGALLSAGAAIDFTSLGATSFGDGATLEAEAEITWDSSGALTIGNGATIAAGTDLIFNGDSVSIGPNAQLSAGGVVEWSSLGATSVGNGAVVDAGDDIVIGGDSITLGANVELSAANQIEIDSNTTLSIGDSSVLDAGGAVVFASTGATSLGQGVQIDAGAVAIAAGGVSIGAGSDLSAANGISVGAGADPLSIGDGAELSAGHGISLTSIGALTVGSGAALSAGDSISVSSGAFSTAVNAQLNAGEHISLAASSVSIGSGASLVAGDDIGIDASGGLTIGAGADLVAGEALQLSGAGVTIGNEAGLTSGGNLVITSGGQTQIGTEAFVVAGTGLSIISDGPLLVGPDGLLQSSGYSADPGGEFPIGVLDPRLGGVYIQAADIDLQGQIVSLNGDDPGEIWIDAGPGADQVILGGTEAPVAPQQLVAGVFQLSDAEFQNLRGALVVGSPINETNGLALEVRNLTINGDHVPSVTIGTYHNGDIGITGVVESEGSAPTVFRIGGAVIVVDPEGPDSVLSGVPRDILITGALGTESNPLTILQMLATRDILMGTQSYIDAVQADALFNPIRPPPGITAPSSGQIFIASEVFQVALNGRMFQQNSGGALGSGVIIGAPTEEFPLINGLDWEEIYDGLDLELDFPTNPPPDLPDLTGGPSGVSLYGVLVQPGGSLIEGGEAARADFLLSPDLLVQDSYFFNGCVFYGACGSPEQNQATTFYDPATLVQDLSTVGPSNNPLVGGNVLIADFIVVPEYDPGVDPNGIAGSVTGAGNGDLWVIPGEDDEEDQ